jgi:glyoxylate reductase
MSIVGNEIMNSLQPHRPKILFTHRIPEKGLNLLKVDFDLVFLNPEKSIDTQLVELLPTVDYLVPLLSIPINEEIISISKNLKGIANYAVGYNNIDIVAAKKYGISVTNTPGVLTNATADLAWALTLGITRRILESDKECRTGGFRGWKPSYMLGFELTGATLGIIGMGRIGTAIAKRGKGFGMNISYHSRNEKVDLPDYLQAKFESNLEILLQSSDIISLNVPYNDETHHLIGKKELKLMKKTSFIINTSRGKVIDEKELVIALQTNQIAGAGLDVFYDEPSIPKKLIELSNVILTPHIGSATVHTRNEMAVMVANNIIAIEKGEIPPNLISELK